MNRDPNGSLDRSAGFFVTLETALVVVSHRPRDASRFELERGVRGAIPDSRERHSAEEGYDRRVPRTTLPSSREERLFSSLGDATNHDDSKMLARGATTIGAH